MHKEDIRSAPSDNSFTHRREQWCLRMYSGRTDIKRNVAVNVALHLETRLQDKRVLRKDVRRTQTMTDSTIWSMHFSSRPTAR